MGRVALEGFETSLNDALGIETGELEQAGGRLLQGAPWDQTDQFAVSHFHATFGGKASGGVADPEMKLSNPKRRKMPYAPAIAVGTLCSFLSQS